MSAAYRRALFSPSAVPVTENNPTQGHGKGGTKRGSRPTPHVLRHSAVRDENWVMSHGGRYQFSLSKAVSPVLAPISSPRL